MRCKIQVPNLFGGDWDIIVVELLLSNFSIGDWDIIAFELLLSTQCALSFFLKEKRDVRKKQTMILSAVKVRLKQRKTVIMFTCNTDWST
jgi:hypothetical protein